MHTSIVVAVVVHTTGLRGPCFYSLTQGGQASNAIKLVVLLRLFVTRRDTLVELWGLGLMLLLTCSSKWCWWQLPSHASIACRENRDLPRSPTGDKTVGRHCARIAPRQSHCYNRCTARCVMFAQVAVEAAFRYRWLEYCICKICPGGRFGQLCCSACGQWSFSRRWLYFVGLVVRRFCKGALWSYQYLAIGRIGFW